MKKLSKTLILFFLLPVGLAITFSIFTNEDGYYRRYRINHLPFVYKVAEGTSSNWIAAIDAGANSWNQVRGAYFEFTNGGTSTASSVALDDVNLIYFDDDFVNFTPGENVIAFSSTFTDGEGSDYHAVESDFIWNAGDFPPATDGDPDHIDLQSTATHEMGHHLGLGHAGAAPGSGQPGAGEVIEDATMFYAVATGDTTPRSLHIDDQMGVSAIYPRWILSGTVLDSVNGDPVPNAFFNLDGVVGAVLGPVEEDVWPGRPQIGGWVVEDTIFVDNQSADYKLIPYDTAFDISFHAFGYKSTDTSIVFSDTQSIEDVINYNPRLAPIDRFKWKIKASDLMTQEPVAVFLEFTAIEDLASGITYTLDIGSSGTDSLSVPPGTYDIVIKPALPYGLIDINGFTVSSDTSLQIELNAAELLIVDNDYYEGMAFEDNVEQYYMDAINDLSAKPRFAFRDLHVQALPDSAQILQFEKVIWFTGGHSVIQLSNEALNLMTFYLDNGGKLFLSGQNLLTWNFYKPLFSDYIKVGIGSDNADQLILYNMPGDPITGDFTFLKITGDEGAFNQTSPDVLTLKDGTDPIFRYSPPNQNLYAAVRTEDAEKDYKLVFFAFGFEAITDFITPANSAQLRKNILTKIFEWLETPPVNAIADFEQAALIRHYHLEQNYPNPFNPNTTIRFNLPARKKVDLEIFAITGEKVRTIIADELKAGVHDVQWDGRNQNGKSVASGLYIYRLKTADFTRSKKMLLIR